MLANVIALVIFQQAIAMHVCISNKNFSDVHGATMKHSESLAKLTGTPSGFIHLHQIHEHQKNEIHFLNRRQLVDLDTFMEREKFNHYIFYFIGTKSSWNLLTSS